MITDGCLYLRRDASGNFVPVKSQPLGDVWISIHALREESDKTAYVANLSSRIISIHALREESDTMTLYHRLIVLEFQSTLSARRATVNIMANCPLKKGFQSTLSARRATLCKKLLNEIVKSISIHALREESDFISWSNILRYFNFNPRSP